MEKVQDAPSYDDNNTKDVEAFDDESFVGAAGSHRDHQAQALEHTMFTKAKEDDIVAPGFIIMPWSTFYKLWWTLTVFGAFLTVFSESYTISFLPAGLKPYDDGASIVEMTLIAVFVLDIFITFFLAFYNEDTEIVVDFKSIVGHYARGMLFWDIVGVFPFYAIALGIAGEMGEDNELTQMLSLLRLFRFVRLHRMIQVFNILQYSPHVSLLALTLTRNYMATLVWVHFNACAFYFISRIYNFQDGRTWIGDVSGLPSMDRYVTSLYFSVVTFSTVGYGDFSPKNESEKIYDVIYMLLNMVFLAWVIGSVSLLVVKSDQRTCQYRDSIEDLEKFSELYDLDDDFHKGLKFHLKLEFKDQESNEEAILSNLPVHAHRKLLRKLYLPSLVKTRLLKGLRRQCVDAFLLACKVELTSVGEDLVQRGTVPSDLYFLLEGTVKLIVDGEEGATGGSTITEMEMGQFVDEVNFLTETPQQETVRTKTVCRTLTISRADFNMVALEYPALVPTLLNNLLEKAERSKAAGSTTDSVSDAPALISYRLNKLRGETTTQFLFAASRGDTDTVEKMCESGFHPDTCDYDQRTALMIAAMKGNTETVLKLIEYRAEPNLVDVHGASALYEAAIHGQDRMVQALLDNGAEPCLTECQAASKLAKAVIDGDIAMMRRLLKAQINPDAGDYDGRTAAHVAAAEGNLPALKLLSEYGASLLTVRDNAGNSIADEAKSSDTIVDILQFLESLEK